MSSEAIDIKNAPGHRSIMRTTLTLDDDILELAARQARLRGVSLGRVVSDLVRKGLNAPTPAQDRGGLVVFQLPADSPRVTTEDVRRLEAEGA
jgi:hypothetical protein